MNAVVVMPLDTNQTDTYGTDDYGQTAIFRNNVQASGISNPVGISSLRSAQQINWDFNQNYTHGSAANYRLFQAIVTCGGKEVARSSIVQINVSNQPVGGGGTGTGTGIGCGTSGQPACKSGETQTYPFEITNPLKGGANDFTSLVKIIAQWIFNLAIPIAVAMIVYAGILFLTAAGEPAKVTKAKEVLKYAVIGLAIILIGSGFVTLIQSILELGGTGQQTEQGPVGPGPVYGPPAPGVVGNKCSKDSNCFTGLKCKNTICQRPTGNWVGEPCAGTTNCDVGLSCDKSNPQPPIDGQDLGLCVQTVGTGGGIGAPCQRDNQCVSGLKCNQICQRKDGNLNGEVCFKTSNPSNCQSKACHTIGAEITGDCIEYKGT